MKTWLPILAMLLTVNTKVLADLLPPGLTPEQEYKWRRDNPRLRADSLSHAGGAACLKTGCFGH